MRVIQAILATITACVLLAQPAGASFHLMQIEQVIGGEDGNAGIQAIQLRMRSAFENLVQQARLVVRDATGANPVLLVDFTASVPNAATGNRVLAATSSFSTATNPPLVPDFTLTNAIPASYLAAGSLTFEDDFGTIYWRLSWGGASYTGPGTGSTLNDGDGNYNPPFAGPLPSTTEQALLFKFAASALSTSNANDYALTTGAATFTRNDGSSGTIVKIVGVGDGAASAVLALGPATPNPVRGGMTYSIALPESRRVRVRILDLGGRAVRTLLDESLPAGRRTYAWTPEGGGPALSSGLYFLELETDGVRKTQRFALIR